MGSNIGEHGVEEFPFYVWGELGVEMVLRVACFLDRCDDVSRESLVLGTSKRRGGNILGCARRTRGKPKLSYTKSHD